MIEICLDSFGNHRRLEKRLGMQIRGFSNDRENSITDTLSIPRKLSIFRLFGVWLRQLWPVVENKILPTSKRKGWYRHGASLFSFIPVFSLSGGYSTEDMSTLSRSLYLITSRTSKNPVSRLKRFFMWPSSEREPFSAALREPLLILPTCAFFFRRFS